MVKNLRAMQETWVRFLGWEDPLEKGMAIQYSCLDNSMDRGAWGGGCYSPWGHKESDTTERLSTTQHSSIFLPGGLPRWLSGRKPACQCKRCGFEPWVGKIPWRRKWQPTPVFLPEKSHGQRKLAGSWGHKKLDTTEQLNNNNDNNHLSGGPMRTQRIHSSQHLTNSENPANTSCCVTATISTIITDIIQVV